MVNSGSKKATRQQTKTHNTQLVLKTIYDSEQISRAEVARATRLTRPTVSNIVLDLLESGLVEEVGQGESAGGKRPTLLAVNSNSRHLLCFDLGSQELQGAIVNLRGTICYRAKRDINGYRGDEILQLIFDLADELLQQTTSVVEGLTVGSPGLLDPHRGLIYKAVNLGWEAVELKSILSKRYNLPVHIINDSHAVALAEYTFGHTPLTSNLILIKTSQGLGAGIIINGQPFYGDGFGAGEIGHVVVAEGGQMCRCGNRGCLETIASTRAILQQAQMVAMTTPSSYLYGKKNVNWEMLLEAFGQNDPATCELVCYVGKYLGIAIANVVACFNIHSIIIVGRVMQFGDVLLEAIKDTIRQRTLASVAEDTVVRFSELGRDGVLLGGAVLLLRHQLGIS